MILRNRTADRARGGLRAAAALFLPLLVGCAAGGQSVDSTLQPSPPDAGEAGELLRLEYEMMEAFAAGDRSALDRIISDEFLLTSATSTGELIDKQAYIAAVDFIDVRAFRFYDEIVRIFGEVGVVHSRLEWKSTWAGAEWSADFLMTDVWVMEDGRWRIASRHSSYPGESPGGGR